MRKKEIMASSDPIEVNDFSNYRSPCICEDCLQKNKQAALDSKQVNQRPFEEQIGHLDTHNQQEHFEEINCECLYKQQEILQQLRDLLEIRPSVVQNYQELKKPSPSTTMTKGSQTPQAIEGLTSDNRVKV